MCAMLNRTQTAMTHYDIQQRRRNKIVEDGRETQRMIVRKNEVELIETARGVRTGVYMGKDGDRPTRIIDALVHEVDPGVVSTIPPPLVGRGDGDRRGPRLDRGQRHAL